MTVADFGAGVGHHVIPAGQKIGPSGTIYAIEIQKDILGRLEKEAKEVGLKNLHPVIGDIEKIGGSTLKDQSTDRVLIINTLFQLGDKDTCLKEAHRVLKPKGKLFISDWQDSFNHLGPHPDQVVTKREAIKIATANGFQLENEMPSGSHHYGLLFRPA